MTDAEMYEPTEPVVLARHVSSCPLCQHRIVPDEEITMVDGDWVHLSPCAEDFNEGAA